MKATFAALASAHAVAVDIPSVKLNNGVEMPMMSLGTWQYDKATAESAVSLALKTGFNHIDTANNYNNQEGVGAALKAIERSRYFLTTKVPAGDGAFTSKALQDDMDQLGIDFVDLMLVHYPPKDGNCQQMQEQWIAMEAFYKAGKARAIGVSNYCPSSLECIKKTATVTPAVNQVQYHVGMGADPIGLKSYCDEHNIHLQAYSPLGDGTSELITGDLVSSIGGVHNKTGAQVSLRWIQEHGVSLTTKTTKESHMRDDLDVFSFELAAAEKGQLDSASAPAGTPSFMCASADSILV